MLTLCDKVESWQFCHVAICQKLSPGKVLTDKLVTGSVIVLSGNLSTGKYVNWQIIEWQSSACQIVGGI